MSYPKQRQFMKSDFAESVHQRSDQAKGVPFPPLQKPLPEGDLVLIDLPDPDSGVILQTDVHRIFMDRQSWRNFNNEALTLKELSYLLFSTQGVLQELGNGYASRRPVPSAGARHPFETYLALNRVEGLEPGTYRKIPFSHQLLLLEEIANLPQLLTVANLGQRFVGAAACPYVWRCI